MNENLNPGPGDLPGADPALDAEKLLSGPAPTAATTPATAPGVTEIGGLVAALRSPASTRELAGEKGALDAFRAGTAAHALKEKDVLDPDGPVRRVVNPRFGARVAVAAVIGSLALGGVAAAATTGSLPGPLQRVAHVLGAPEGGDDETGTEAGGGTGPTDGSTTEPSAAPSGTSSKAGRGPNALGPAAWGLCRAFGTKTWGDGAHRTGGIDGTASADPAGRKPDNPSVAYRNLVAAAAAKGVTVDEFCRVVLDHHGVPGTWPSAPDGSPRGTPKAEPTHDHGQQPGRDPGKSDHGQSGHGDGGGSADGNGNGH